MEWPTGYDLKTLIYVDEYINIINSNIYQNCKQCNNILFKSYWELG